VAVAETSNVNSPFAVTSTRLAALALLAGLAACSSITDGLAGDKVDYRTGTPKAKALEVPPDLTQLARESRYQTQGGVVSAAAAAGAGGPAANTAAAAAGPATVALASQGQMRVERAEQQRWLVVPLTPEQLWPQLKAFWEQRGFAIEGENAAAGVMETGWAENRAKLPNDLIRNTLGKVFGNAYDTGERDRYRTRLERTAAGTEVYIAHRGLIEIYNDAQREGTTWRARPADPQLEAEMLSRLMVMLGAKDEPARAMVAAAAPAPASAPTTPAGTATPGTDQPGRARALAGAALEVDEPFDRAWRRVGLTLDRSGFSVEDRDRAAGVYFVRYVDPKSAGKEEPGWWGRLMGETATQVPVRYRVSLKGSGNKTTINVLTSAGGAEVGENGQRIATQLVRDLR
jgi:outer membrane protein assembly factor BamC